VRRVHLLATGGAIASRQGPEMLAAVAPATELLAAAGSLPGLTVSTSALGSFAFTTSTCGDALGLRRRARRRDVRGSEQRDLVLRLAAASALRLGRPARPAALPLDLAADPHRVVADRLAVRPPPPRPGGRPHQEGARQR
jgi:hypothetical protein